MYILGYPLLSLVNIIDTFLFVYSIVIFAVCIFSFINPDPNMPLVRVLNQLTQPVFVYLRKYIPQIGMFDIIPLAVLLIIMFIRGGILPIFETFARGLIT